MLIEASTTLTLVSLALITGSAVAIPLSGGISIPVSAAGVAGGILLEGVAITGYATAGYMLLNSRCRD